MEKALDPESVPAAVMRKSILKVSNTLKLSPRNAEADQEALILQAASAL